MPTNAKLSEKEHKQLEKGGGLKERTIKDRLRDFNYFKNYFELKSSKTIQELNETEDRRETLTQIFCEFFFSL